MATTISLVLRANRADETEECAEIDLAVVVGLLMSLPHVTQRPLERADFERIVDEVLLPLWSTRAHDPH